MPPPGEGYDPLVPTMPFSPPGPRFFPMGFGTTETLPLPLQLEMDDLVRFTADEFPDLHLRLVRGFGSVPPEERYGILFFLRRMKDLQGSNTEIYELEKSIYRMETETESLGEAIRNDPDGDNAAEQRDSLKKKLGELFDLRGERRETEAKRIEADLKRIRDLLEQRRANRDAIIEKRFMELTSENDGLEW